MIPWLLLVETLSAAGRPFSELLRERMEKFPVSGEINSKVSDPHGVLAKIEAHYKGKGPAIDHVDGLSMEFAEWRFNLRPSNTEPVIRLNVEVRQDKGLLEEKTAELLTMIRNMA